MNRWLFGALAGSSIAVLAIGFARLLAFLSAKFEPKLVEERQRMTCPVSHQDVNVTFIKDAERGRRLGVTQCTAFVSQDRVTCGSECVALLNATPPDADGTPS